MEYLSVCSGIEAASVAWHPIGWTPLAFSEIEPFPRAVLAHHYPDVPCHGDFTKLRDEPWIVDADVLVGGTPCQAFSVAGLRKSLDDDRGNLSLEFVRLADAIDDLRTAGGRDPSIIVWENVPGVLSVKDNAFGCFLAALAGDVAPYVPPRGKWTNAGVVAGPQRAVAWRVLDAQYFGLAQRRRRVFVVASARDGFDPAAVLLEFEGVRRDTPPRREAGKAASGGAASRAGERSHWDGVDNPHPTLNHSHNTGGVGQSNQDLFSQRGAYLVGDVTTARMVAFGEYSDDGTASTLKSRDYKDATDLVTHTLRGEGFDASEDGTDRGTPLVPVLSNDPAHAICANEAKTYTNEGNMFQLRNVVAQPVAYSIMPQNSGKDYKAREVEVAQPIMAGGPVGGNQGGDYVLQPVHAHGFYQNQGSHGSGNNDELSPTLKAADSNNLAAAAIAFSYKDSGNDAAVDLSPTLRSLGAYDANGGGQMAVAIPVQEVGKRTEASTDDPRAGIGIGIGQDGDAMYTLQAGAQHGVAIGISGELVVDEEHIGPLDVSLGRGQAQVAYAFQPRIARNGRGDMGEVVNAQSGETGKGDAAPCVAVQASQSGVRLNDTVGTLDANYGSRRHNGVMQQMAVRRLTPRECERLQGFPDDYTMIPWKKKPADQCPDGPRYKALGNSMAVPCMAWIGRRIAAHLKGEI